MAITQHHPGKAPGGHFARVGSDKGILISLFPQPRTLGSGRTTVRKKFPPRVIIVAALRGTILPRTGTLLPVPRSTVATILPEGAGHTTWRRSSIAVRQGATSFALTR